jgi:hypothetical protein
MKYDMIQVGVQPKNMTLQVKMEIAGTCEELEKVYTSLALFGIAQELGCEDWDQVKEKIKAWRVK